MKNYMKIIMLLTCLPFMISANIPTYTFSNKTYSDSKKILKNLHYIPYEGIPGDLVVYGKNASVVLTNNKKSPVIALSHYGRGKAVALTHTCYFTKKYLENKAGRKLLHNLVNLSPGKKKTILCVGANDLGKVLNNSYANVMSVNSLPRVIDSFDIIFYRLPHDYDANFRDKQIAKLKNYISKGGILVATAIGWVFESYGEGKEGKTLKEFYGNKLYSPMGIYWNRGYASGTNKKYYIKHSAGNSVHLLKSINKCIAKINNKKSEKNIKNARTEFNTFYKAINALPDINLVLSDIQIQSLITKFKNLEEEIIPTRDNPIAINDSEAIYLITLMNAILKKSNRALKFTHLAQEFPGPVKKFNPIDKKVTIDTSIPRWHSTGLYAPPGHLIKIKIPGNMTSSGLGVQIGSHQDKLFSKDSWKRWPDLINKKNISSTSVTIHNPHGGLIYITVPPKCIKRSIIVKISGAIQAPYFKLKETSLKQWKKQLQLTRAPWGEIQGKNIIITVPTDSLINLKNPTKVIKWWDRIIDTIEDLSQKDRRKCPERFVCDMQISAGYMHSGYPIMTHLDVKDKVLGLPDGKIYKEGSWGYFHEIGHHHQNSLWTFKGTGEVTVNLFTLYAMDQVVGITPFEHTWLTNNFKKGRNYIKRGASFKKWQSDPGLGLIMYIQLQKKFGWEAYKKIFVQYKNLPKNKAPKTDAQKRDFWMVSFSKQVGYNLGPFFKMWGIPLSKRALNSVQNLPLWMPDSL